jgi:hypothetical protein
LRSLDDLPRLNEGRGAASIDERPGAGWTAFSRACLAADRGDWIESVLRVRRSDLGVFMTSGGEGGRIWAIVCDDLSIAALTVDSIVASLGRRVVGIWSSSCYSALA